MSLTEREKQTQTQYEETAEVWISKSGGKDRPCFWEGEMERLSKTIQKDSKVIELGSGPATDGKYLKLKGFDVTSLDYASSMLLMAKELDPTTKALQGNIYETPFADSSFDAFRATASVLHLENPQKALKEVARITKNQGTGFISIKEGVGNEIDPRTNYSFWYYTQGEFTDILENAGFDVVWADKKTGLSKSPLVNLPSQSQ